MPKIERYFLATLYDCKAVHWVNKEINEMKRRKKFKAIAMRLKMYIDEILNEKDTIVV